MVIKGGTLVLEDRLLRGDVRVRDDRICEIEPDIVPGQDEVVMAEGRYVVPGLVDIHTHGRMGHDTMEATFAALEAMSLGAAKSGTTTFLPTTCTMPVAAIRDALRCIRENASKVSGAQIAGAHLEGPFLNPRCNGAQAAGAILAPSMHRLEELCGDCTDVVRKITLAPEIEGALPLVEKLSSRGCSVSIGHTAAGYQEALRAFACGANSATHVYNAMTPMRHREPGAVGAVMLSKEVFAELILDGTLVSYPAASILWKLKGPKRMILVSDSLEAAGLGDGTFQLGGQMFAVRNGVAAMPDGTLVGSVISLIDMVKNAVTHMGIPLYEAVRAASLNPAVSVGLTDRGTIAVGKQADLFLMDENFAITTVWIRGRRVPV